MNNNKLIYSLSVDDLQTVAKQEIGRELSLKEIEKISKIVEEKINWYEITANIIIEEISNLHR